MLLLSVIAFTLGLQSYVLASPVERQADDTNPILYDGRAQLNLTQDDLVASNGPFLAVVMGNESAGHYFQLLGNGTAPTPIWSPVQEQALHVLVDNSSIFAPGGNSSQEQFGFRRSELIAQQNKTDNRTAFNERIESNLTAFHFSVQSDPSLPLNFTHEYQPVFIEIPTGEHVFDLQTGEDFNTTTPDSDARTLRLRSNNGTVMFKTAFTDNTWHNFAVAVDWNNDTLQVFYSQNETALTAVSNVEDNSSVGKGAAAQGDFHFGLLKLPRIDPADTPANQGDVAHHGLQEGSTEALVYSGIFVENAQNGVSAGNGGTVSVGNCVKAAGN